MQTFLPYRSFRDSARVLDRARLGKQRVEARDILCLLVGRASWCSNSLYAFLQQRYKHHPAVLQWAGHELALFNYIRAVCQEWVERNYKDNCLTQSIETIRLKYPLVNIDCNLFKAPEWLGNETFHASHRAALLAKNQKHYQQFNWKEEPRIDYFWPVRINKLQDTRRRPMLH